MKKMARIISFAALSVFIFASIVSADDDNGWRGFHGVYEMIANGSCLHSTKDFYQTKDGFYKPKPDSDVWGATSMVQGTLVFKRNGEGTASGENYVIDFPPGRPDPSVFDENSPTGPIVRDSIFAFSFNFEVTRDRVITVTLKNGFELDGMVSKDRKTITLGSAYQYIPDIPNVISGPAYCNYGRVLIRVGR
jgi:hypothetical protein